MTVHFIGAGPGAPDLITVRGRDLIARCPVCLYAGSLVPRALLEHCPPGARIVDTAPMSLDEIVAECRRATDAGQDVARLHSGDLSVWSAMGEQLRRLDALGIPYSVTPGVPSFAAAAAALGQELTIPDASQSLILTRRAQRTSMPANEELAAFAAHGTTMALFLSVRRPRELQADLLAGGYAENTPCAVVYRASWPDEIVIRCPLAELGERVRAARITTQALVLVGPALGDGVGRSHVYDAGYGHRHRPLGRPDRYRSRA